MEVTDLTTRLHHLLYPMMLGMLPFAACGDDSVGNWLTGFDFRQVAPDGFIQTPAGGLAESSSRRRPTFDELNIDHVITENMHFGWQKDRHLLLVDAHFMRETTHSVLPQALVSQGQRFASGERVYSDVQIDWWGANYLNEVYTTEVFDTPLTLSAGVGVVMLDFRYRLIGDNATASRHYTKAGYRLGVSGELQLAPRLTLTAAVFDALQFTRVAEITSADLTLHYQLWKNEAAQWNLLGGVNYQHVHYQGGKPISNHVDFRTQAAPVIGIAIRF